MHLANNAAFEGSVPMSIVNLKFLISKKTQSYAGVSKFQMSVWLSWLSVRDSLVPWLTCSKRWCVQGSIPPIASPRDQLLPRCGVWSQLISWNKQQTYFGVIFAMKHQPLHTFLVFHKAGLNFLSPPVHMDWLWVGKCPLCCFLLLICFPIQILACLCGSLMLFLCVGFIANHNREHWGREENVS